MSDTPIILDPSRLSPSAGVDAPALTYGPAATPVAAAGDTPIIESDTARFVADVIEASHALPVIVDFWAPWCEPCKTLGPALEKLVRRAGGLVRMVKINVDENKALAQQLHIQSIPTVYAFKGGRPVDSFQGALPESQLKIFIDRLLGDAKPPVEEAMAHAAELLHAGNAAEAEHIYTQILAHDPTLTPALAGMIRAVALTGEVERAREMVEALDDKTRQLADIRAAISALELAEQGARADTDTQALAARLASNPDDAEARYDLADAEYAAGRAEAAIDQLLELVARKRGWNDDAARKQLVRIFDALGAADPRTVEGRRRLSTLLFS